MPRVHVLPRTRRDLRFASGLVLFAYITLHLSSHALGLVSMDLAERALELTAGLWQSLPGTALLYGAAFVHVGLALLALYERRTLRMPAAHALRVVLGLVMPIALITHFVGTRYAFERYGLAAEYPRVVGALWSGGGRGLALGLLAPGWLHGCLGLRFALGHRRAWQRAKPVLFAIALLLPVLSAVGFVTMARTVEAARADGTLRSERVPEDQVRDLLGVRDDVLGGYLGAVALVVVARVVRRLDEHRRRALVRIAYPGRTVDVPRGWSVLEASRTHGVPHLAACGGRARCSTCRVRVLEGLDRCRPPTDEERRTLARVRAPGDVRLACQLRPEQDVVVEPVLAVDGARWHAALERPHVVEREATLLAMDMELDPALSAHDRFYALERCRSLAEELFESTGGIVVGAPAARWCAAYGLEGAAAAGARRALDAAERLVAQADELARRLGADIGATARAAVAVHAAPVVVGRIGDPAGARRVAVGEAVDALDEMLVVARLATPPIASSPRVHALANGNSATAKSPAPSAQATTTSPSS